MQKYSEEKGDRAVSQELNSSSILPEDFDENREYCRLTLLELAPEAFRILYFHFYTVDVSFLKNAPLSKYNFILLF